MKKYLAIYSILFFMILLFTTSSQAKEMYYSCKKNDTDAIRCMLCNCYYESKGESFSGKVAVTRTVIARMKSNSFPDSACGVIYQAKQFSWANGAGNNRDIRTSKPEDIQSFVQCGQAVDKANALGAGALYFFNPVTAENKSLSKGKKLCAVIDRHHFLNPASQGCPSSVGDGNIQQKTLRGKIGGSIK